jgi:glycerol-3-phosphate dehydrogenase
VQPIETIRRPIAGEHFHVIVIGGGINGVAIARECARRGRRTLLVEQSDFAAGTTSRSTRIIHGGLRYLEHGELGLVRESLRERERLLRERPHLVHPVEFLLALDGRSQRSALAVRTGLFLYKMFGGPSRSGNSHSEQYRLERVLDAGRSWSLFNFEDAQCEFPERLLAEWLGEAAEAGAEVRNHTQALAVDIFHGRAKGVLLRDALNGNEERVEANWIINATGPWADRVCHRSGVKTSHPMVGGVRGSHIVLPRFPGAPSAAVYAEATDGRPIFVVPWNGQMLVGTTEVADSSDPAKVKPSAEEVVYLVRALQHLFPGAGMSQHDVVYSFAGVRPLPFSPKSSPSAVTRKHFLHDHKHDGAAQLISVIGGKLTTAASLARQCADYIGTRGAKPGSAVALVERDLDPVLDRAALEIAATASISEAAARAMLEWHGSRSLQIAQLAATRAQMKAPICRHSEHVVAEAVYAIGHEHAVTLGDILLRRVPVALGGCWSESCSRDAAARISAALGWDEHKTAAELEAFECERTAFLRRPAESGVLLEAAAD